LGHWKLAYDDKTWQYVTIDENNCKSSTGKKGKTKLGPVRIRLACEDGWNDVILGGNDITPSMRERETRFGTARLVESIPQTEKP